MNALPLNGMSGSNPVGAMAAFGLFRILDAETPFGVVRMAWEFELDWHPVLHFQQEVAIDQLIPFLIDRQTDRVAALFLNWNDDIKCDPSVFKKHLMEVATEPSRQEDAAFFAAFGSELVTAKSTPDVKPTAFHMTAGQQRFLRSASELAESLNPSTTSSRRQTVEQRREELRDAYHRALQGPWTYSDKQHSLGWDPTTEGLYALSDVSPSAAGPRSERAAVWLAVESLPLFPCAPEGKLLKTAGFDKKSEYFTWPIWEPPVSLETICPWLASQALSAPRPRVRQLRSRGISALFRSQCIRDGNGRGTFRNSVQLN